MIELEKYRESFALMGLKQQQYFDLRKKDEYWMHHFLIKSKPICEEINRRLGNKIYSALNGNNNYNFLVFIYLDIKFNSEYNDWIKF